MSGCSNEPHSRKVKLVGLKAGFKREEDAAAERERIWREKIELKKAQKQAALEAETIATSSANH